MEKNHVRFWDRPRVSTIISLVSFLGFLGLGIWTVVISAEQSRLNFWLAARTVQPRLTLVGQPKVTHVEIEANLKLLQEHQLLGSRSAAFGPPPDVPARTRIRISFRLKNIGTGLARMVAELYGDTVSWEPILRRRFQEVVDSKLEAIREVNERPRELLPGDSTDLQLDFGILYPDGDTAVVHVMILYANDMGNLYDTYLRVGYIVDSSGFTVQGVERNGTPGLLVINERKRADEMVVPFDIPSPLFKVYEPDDSRELGDLFLSWKNSGSTFGKDMR